MRIYWVKYDCLLGTECNVGSCLCYRIAGNYLPDTEFRTMPIPSSPDGDTYEEMLFVFSSYEGRRTSAK